MSPLEGAVPVDLLWVSRISLAKAAKVVKKLLCVKAPGLDEIHPEMLRHWKLSGYFG